MKILPTFFLGAFLAADISTAQPYTVWNTFQEPGNNYSSYGETINGSASGGGHYQGMADSFAPSASGSLYSVSLTAFSLSGSGGINVFVAANNNSQPGTILESFLDVAPTGTLTLDSVAAPLLSRGVTYWLYVEPAAPNTYAGWADDISNPSASYIVDAESVPGVWGQVNPSPAQAQAFDVVLVPEPSIWTLVLGGLAVGAISRRRSRMLPRG